jgi:hypothetical protein
MKLFAACSFLKAVLLRIQVISVFSFAAILKSIVFFRPSSQTLAVAYRVQLHIALVKTLQRCLISLLRMKRVKGQWCGRTLGRTRLAR